jgi:hypothetical protein
MFPGLMRTAATPASIAFSARLALKWMSAMTGSGESRTILRSASASSVFGTAQRTISHPAEASAAICAVVASTSCVMVSVIDWTTTGAPPPIGTFPTRIWRWLGISASVEASGARPSDDGQGRKSPYASCAGVTCGRQTAYDFKHDGFTIASHAPGVSP